MKPRYTGRVAMAFLFSALIFMPFLSLPVQAGIPGTINYQGYLTNASGVPVNGAIPITFRIYDVPSGGTALWTETQDVTVNQGVYSVSLGGNTALSLSFDVPYYLGVTVGADAEMTPRKELTSVGYAFRAKSVESVGGHSHIGEDIASGTVAEARIDSLITRDSEVMTIVRANDGAGSDLNADLLDGLHASAFASISHSHSGGDITSGVITEARIDPLITRDSEVMTIVKANDGAGSGLDADLVDGLDASAFSLATHNHDATYLNVTGDTMTGMLTINQGASSGAAAKIQITTPTNASPAIEAATSGYGAALLVTNSGTTGPAGYFQITNSSSAAHALYVQTNGTGYGHGIFSYSTGLSRAGFFEINNSANGGEAILARTNGTGQAFHGTTSGTSNAGVFDITNASNSAEALYVATNGTGRSGYFQISNASSGSDTLYATTNGTGNAIRGYTTGSGYSGFFQGGAGLYVAGNLNVTGNLTKGSGSFVQPHKKDPSKEIVYAFFEGPEHAIFLRGKAKLVDGRAVIETPEYFRDVAGSDEDVTVQFTPRSSRSKGLAAVEVTKGSIRVEELMEGKGTYEFDYFITAKRAGFEGHQPVQKNTHFSAHNGTQEEFERRYADTSDMTVRAMRDMLIASGILKEDGRLNRDVAERLGWKVKDQEYALK